MTRYGPISLLVLAFAACPVFCADEPEVNPRMVRLAAMESKSLDAEMLEVLRGLVTAAVESGGAFQVVDRGPDAGQDLSVEIRGRGPWKISARLDGGRIGSGKVGTGEHTFADREEMTGAVDELIAELATLWPGGELVPVPLAEALSPSTLAVDAYLDGLALFGSSEMDEGQERLEEALAIDPGFILAGAELIYLDLTRGYDHDVRGSFARLAGRERKLSPALVRVLRGFELIINQKGLVMPATTQMVEESGLIRWGSILRGMARLAERAAGGPPKPFPRKPAVPDDETADPPEEPPRPQDPLDDWKRVISIDPGDPRGLFWLARGQMSIGQLRTGAATLAEVTGLWPDLLEARVLRAEALVRLRKPAEARTVLEEMKRFMLDNSLPVVSARSNPDLMLGSVHLLEGNFDAAQALFEKSLAELMAAGAPHEATAVLYRTLIEMLRDAAVERDPLFNQRKLEEARQMLARYEESMTTSELEAIPWEILRLRGHIDVKAGDTIDAWKTATQIRSYRDRPGYSEYDAAYLEGATMLKEGDLAGSIEAFDRVVRVRGSLVDQIDLGQLQLSAKRFEAALATFQRVGEALERFSEPAVEPFPHGNELIIAEPHLASLIPVYCYFRARLAFFTGQQAESRRYFNRMLTYYRDPGPRVMGMVREALQRGAKAEGGP